MDKICNASIVSWMLKDFQCEQGRIQEFVQGVGLKFFLSRGGAQHPLGHKTPLKSIDFTGQGGA